MTKKLLAMALVLVFCLSVLPFGAVASGEPAEEITEEAAEEVVEEAVEEIIAETAESVEAIEISVIDEEENPAEEPLEEEEIEQPVTDGASSGTCGVNLTWTLSNSGVLTISGTGAMYNYGNTASTLSPWMLSYTSIRSIVIASGVTSIGDWAFPLCSNVQSVSIPSTVTSIGEYAFSGCTSLSSISIPNSVKSIGGAAFWECSSLSEITIPDSVTTIGEFAFYACDSAKSLTIGSGLRYAGIGAFSYCQNLTTVTIDSGLEEMEEGLFCYCSSLSNITIPSTVTKIGLNVFDGCTRLTDVYYTGTEYDWTNISFSSGNSYLLNAAIHCVSAESIGPVKLSAVVSTQNTSVGDYITVTVYLDENPGVSSFSFALSSSAQLSATKVEYADEFLKELDSYVFPPVYDMNLTNGHISFASIYNLDYVGPLYTVTYEVVSEGTASFAFSDYQFISEDFYEINDISMTLPGTVTISSTAAGSTGGTSGGTNNSTNTSSSTYIPGDINNNGTVDISDVQILLKYVNKQDVENQIVTAACDCNNNGTVDISDVQILLKYVNKQDVTIY